jgi:hypothetical protein
VYYFLFFIAAFSVIMLVLVWTRKLHWDAIHMNLLELVDEFGGDVIRNGFSARPVYKHNFDGIELIINFSSQRTQKGRTHFMDISLGREFKAHFTIAARSWLQREHGQADAGYQPDDLLPGDDYALRKGDDGGRISADPAAFKEAIEKILPMNFMYIGATGALYERECDNLAMATRPHELIPLINNLKTVIGVIV